MFWAHATTITKFEESYRVIAETAKIICRNEPYIDVLSHVNKWLSSPMTRKWVMILDGADDMSTFSPVRSAVDEDLIGQVSTERSPLLSRYLPASKNGTILLTTRNEDVGFRMTHHEENIVRVQQMEDARALKLIRKKLGIGIDEHVPLSLIRTHGSIPLAITQAGSYIRHSVPQILELEDANHLHLDHRTEAAQSILDGGGFRSELTASSPVMSTVKVSLDYISERHPSAVNLLALMSIFDS